jgi:cytochrome oxidase Cu insertion factor (SCO1/SenC/PrrC family)
MNKSYPTKQLGFLALVLIVLMALAVASCSSEDASQGEKAPPFSLAASTGERVSLEQLLQGHDTLVLVFYRGVF